MFVVALTVGWFGGAEAAPNWWDTSAANGLTAGSGVWSTFSNDWATAAAPGTAAPVAWTDGNDAFFTVNNGVGNRIGVSNVTANSITISQSNYVFTNWAGGVLTIGGGGITISQSATFNNDINLGANQSWSAGSTLTMAGVVTEGVTPVTLTKGGSGLLTFSNTVAITGGLRVDGTLTTAGTVRNLNASITTPFGVGNIILNNGTLALTPVSGSAVYSGVTNAGAAFQFGTNAVLQLTIAAGQTLQYTIGASAAPANSVVQRTGNGTLVIAYSAANRLGGVEKFVVNGGVTNINDMVGPYIVGRAASGAYDFLRYDAVNGFTNVTYDLTNPTGGGDTSAKVQLTSVTLNGNLTGYVARISGAANNLAGQQIRLGDGVNPTALGLSSTLVSNGTIVINGNTEWLVPVNGTGTLASEVTGTGLLNKFGTGTLILSNAGLYGGNVLVQSGTVTFSPTVSTTYGGALEGPGTWSKDGSQVLTLTGTNNLLAALTVIGGGLNLTNGGLNVVTTTIGSATALAQFITRADSVFASDTVNIGTVAGTTGDWTSLGGSSVLGTLVLGNNSAAGSTGSFLLAGGTMVINGLINASARGPGAATVGVADGDLLVGGTIFIGTENLGVGTFTLSGGTVNAFGLQLGGNAASFGTSTGIAYITGGTLVATNGSSSSRRIHLGRGAGYGELTISNGYVEAGALQVGGSSSATEPGTGKFVILGGTNKVRAASNTAPVLTIGQEVGSTGEVVVAGTGLLDAGTVPVFVGQRGIGTLTISNGAMRAGTLAIASNSTAQGTLTMVGGSLTVSNTAQTAPLDVGFAGQGALHLNGGTLTVDKLTATNGANSLITFAGGTLITRRTTVANGTALVVGGTLTLTNGTAVGAMFHSFADGLTIDAAGTLRGNGTVIGNTTVDGTIAPGFSVGKFTFSNDLTLAGTTVLELDKLNGTGSNDFINVLGALQYGGTLTVTNIGAALALGDTFDLFDFSGFSSAFVITNLPTLTPGLAWDSTLLGAQGIITVVVPEPSALALSVGGLVLGMLLLRRRRASTHNRHVIKPDAQHR